MTSGRRRPNPVSEPQVQMYVNEGQAHWESSLGAEAIASEHEVAPTHYLKVHVFLNPPPPLFFFRRPVPRIPSMQSRYSYDFATPNSQRRHSSSTHLAASGSILTRAVPFSVVALAFPTPRYPLKPDAGAAKHAANGSCVSEPTLNRLRPGVCGGHML